MAFHKSNLGAFGSNLPCDLHGYVPQFGDNPEDFVFDRFDDWDEDEWYEFVAAAEKATLKAEAELARWQNE